MDRAPFSHALSFRLESHSISTNTASLPKNIRASCDANAPLTSFLLEDRGRVNEKSKISILRVVFPTSVKGKNLPLLKPEHWGFSIKSVNQSISTGLAMISGCETPNIFCDKEGAAFMTVSREMQDCDHDGILDPACVRTNKEGGTSVAKFFPSSQICLDPSKDEGTFRGVRILNSCQGIYHKPSVDISKLCKTPLW